jgi:DNA-binding NtrC family response regulator
VVRLKKFLRLPILPAMECTAALPHVIRTPEAAAGCDPHAADPARLPVLVVEDEPDIRDLLSAYFGGRGHAVASARDGQAALSALDRAPGRYGLVVTDLNMPGADGLAVLRAARRANPCCFVIIVTGFASLDSAVEAVRLGAYDYLTKPFTMGQLDVILSRIADRLALEERNRVLGAQLSGRSASPRDLLALLVTVAARLDGLEARMAEIAALVRGLGEGRPRS